MADPQTNLRVRISAELGDIKSGLVALRNDLAKVKTDASKSMPDTRDFESGLKRVRGLLTGLFAGLSAGALFKGIIGETGQAQAELAQLRAALKSTGEVAGLTEGNLVDMAGKFAKATTHSTDEIIEAQTRLLSYSGIAKDEFPRALQLAIDQSIRLGENITQSAETVGKALEYPAEGISALTKQGFRFTDQQKELLKELEKTGRLAEAQAIVMEVMEESYAGAADAARKTLPGALKVVRNAFAELLDGSGGEGVNGLIAALNNLADVLTSPAMKESFGELADQVLASAAAFAQWMAQDGARYLITLAKAVGELVRNLDVLVVFMVARMVAVAIPATIAGFARLRLAILAARTATLSLSGAMALLGGPVGIAIAALAAGLYYLYQRTNQAKQAVEEHNNALQEHDRLARISTQAAHDEALERRRAALATIQQTRALLEQQRARLNDTIQSQSSIGMAKDSTAFQLSAQAKAIKRTQMLLAQQQKELDDWTERLVKHAWELQVAPSLAAAAASAAGKAASDAGKAVRGMADQAVLAQDAIARALAELERLFEAGDVGIASYYAQRVALQRAAIDGQIAQAQEEARAAKTSEAQSKALTEIIKLQRDRAELGAAGARDQEKAEEALAKQLGDVHLRLLELDGETVRAGRVRLEEEFAALIVKLQADADHAGVALVRSLINREAARDEIEKLQAEMQKITGNLSATESSLSAQSSAGMLGGVEAERQISAERAIALEQLRALREASLAYLATLNPDSPEYGLALKGLQEINGSIAQITASQQKMRQQVQDAAVNSLATFFTDLATRSKSAKDALKDFVVGFVQSMAQIAARALATMLVLRALDAIYPGLGKATAATMGAGVHHTGGIAGFGARFREVSPLLFGAAPRYHAGGIAGLAPNEVPAILERGEEVLTRNDPRHRDNGGGEGAGRVTTPIVAIGDDAVANALAGAAGENVVMTHVRNNWEGLQRGG